MARKPQIILSSLDVDRIEALLAAIPSSVFPGKVDLQAGRAVPVAAYRSFSPARPTTRRHHSRSMVASP